MSVARTGGVLVGLYCILYAAAGALIGAAGRVFLPALEDTDLAFARICEAVLPVGLRGLVLSASLAAIMSTATACLLATSTVFIEDVYRPLRHATQPSTVRQTRYLTLILGVLAAAVACVMHDVIAALTIGYNRVVGAIFVPIMGAVLWQRGTTRASLLSTIPSGIAVVGLVLVYRIDSTAPTYGGLAISAAECVGVSPWRPEGSSTAGQARTDGQMGRRT